MATDTSVPIAANGDVYLLVGPDSKRLRVSSQILRNASTYFSNLFGPNFAEGQNLSSGDPKEVPMPDDDARAVETICNIIHLQNDAVPLGLAPVEVFEIAVAADKFDCASAVKLASILWLKTSGTEVQVVSELAHLMGAAYILDNGDAFAEITLAMMMRHKESYLPLAEYLPNFVPCKVLFMLEERRNKLRVTMLQILYDTATDAGLGNDGSNCSCAWSGRHLLAHTKLLNEYNLQPRNIPDMTVAQVIEKMGNMHDPVVPQAREPCEYRWHSSPNYRASRGRSLKNELAEEGGLCIDCVKSGDKGVKMECRKKHEVQ